MSVQGVAYLGLAAAIVLTHLGWKVTARSGYESAEYTVIASEKPFEIRKYPDLMMATTKMRFRSQGGDGSFMRLFRYISGANDVEQKVAMTTPVFMQPETSASDGQMGFVIPKQVSEQGIPGPSSENVQIQKRSGGRFAVIRFAGRMKGDSVAQAEADLREWIREQGMQAEQDVECAGYDPPWTPGPLRRNEILIRLQ